MTFNPCGSWGSPAQRRHLQRPGRRAGSSVLQTVLVLPLLLGLVLGVAEFGQFFYIRSAFVAAARDAARAACLQTAASTDPATKATATLAQANVTFQPSWMTIVDATNANAVVSDVTSVPYGDTLVVTISATYGSIPNAYRPLYAMTGIGVSPTRPCAGVCRMIRE